MMLGVGSDGLCLSPWPSPRASQGPAVDSPGACWSLQSGLGSRPQQSCALGQVGTVSSPDPPSSPSEDSLYLACQRSGEKGGFPTAFTLSTAGHTSAQCPYLAATSKNKDTVREVSQLLQALALPTERQVV